MDEQKKRMVIEMLERFVSVNTNQKVREALNQFETNRRISKIQNQFFAKLLDTGVGRVVRAFQRWQKIPDPVNPESLVAANKFERQLASLASRSLRFFWDPVKEGHFHGINRKRRAAVHLLHLTQNDQKRMFVHWINSVRAFKQIDRCRQSIQFFEQIQTVI